MMQRFFIIFLAAVTLSACATTPVPTAKLNWAGTYSVLGQKRINNPNTITGKSSRVIGTWRLNENTTNVSASMGTHFGINYTFGGEDFGSPVKHKVIWYFPKEGLTNPIRRQSAYSFEKEKTCRVGIPCLTGWVFKEPWELVSGTWVVEIWTADQCLIRQSFEISKNASNQTATPDR